METKKTELVKINPQDYNLNATEASQVEKAFVPMLNKMAELEEQFNEVCNLPIEPTTCRKAKELRLQYVKIRTATSEIHKVAKSYYLNGGRFVDGWKNAQAFASQGKEKTLENIEKHFEILEAERKAALKIQRTNLILEYTENPEMYQLAEMSEAAFEQLLNGLKLAKEQREAAEKAAELERIRIEQEKIKEEARIRAENERLKKEAEIKQKQIEAERKAAELERQKQEAKLQAERKAAEQARIEAERIAAAEKEAIEEAARIEREKANAILQAEKEAKAKLEAEIKAKEQARIEAERIAAEKEAARLAAEKAAAAAPDKTKFKEFVKELENLKYPEIKTAEAGQILNNTKILIQKTINYINENLTKI